VNSALALSIRTPLRREDLPGLCRRVAALLEGSQARSVRCDVSHLPAEVVTVEALARLKLIAHRRGMTLELAAPSAALRDLLEFTGLDDTLLGRASVRPHPES